MADVTIHPQRLLDHLNHEFERLHTAKENAFWTAHMGLLADADAAQATLNERERELAGFMHDPERLRVVEALVHGSCPLLRRASSPAGPVAAASARSCL